MRFTLYIWRQPHREARGALERYEVDHISPDASFLEMLDALNEELIERDEDPVAFDSDCREGICGSCGMIINGIAHGPFRAMASCQLHMRHFRDGDTIYIEPFRAEAFPLVKDLIVNRSALDRIIEAGGYISVPTGGATEANNQLVPGPVAERALDAAACIGCGACVAACPNAAAQLFTAAKISHLRTLPQGQPERFVRAQRMVRRMESEGFGSCSNYAECEAVCPAEISINTIARMNYDFLKSKFKAQ